MGENKQVRVDNWGIFFLQRLQLFFSKTDYCDLTLLFQGNVQLKVHRLVLNACTEYFELLEHSDRLVDDNVILMPEILQTDVVVPIINFMYTGMLEYPIGLYHKLYQAADLMRMSVLTKLLDAQKQPINSNRTESTEKIKPTKSNCSVSRSVSSVSSSQTKKVAAKNNFPELPAPLPGRKLPVWKRKTVLPTSSISGFSRSEPRVRSDPLALEDAGKPTRFEWPDDDLELPPLDTMDISEFGGISYTSKPLLREDEVKPIIYSQSEPNTKQVKEELSEIAAREETNLPEDSNKAFNDKRKISTSPEMDKSPKRIKIVESEKDTTISVISSGSSINFDPTKIVSEILKKYPTLMKKNKNIKLKIVTKQKEKDSTHTNDVQKEVSAIKDGQMLENSMKISEFCSKDNTWSCKTCTESSGKPMVFMLYYLYRKHMTDVHNIKFDPRICKYCGLSFARGDLHSLHLFTKHGIKPSGNQVFPSCSQCPYVALSKQALQTHRSKHRKSEMQCSECKLAFVSRDAISSHIQITGHMGKTRKNIYDCQYCMKTSQSAISLLSHIKSNHESEGMRDGIVSLDEIDLEEGVELDEEDHVEEGEADGEYIIPEITAPAKKVKIISDVKVPATKSVNRTEEVTVDNNKVQSNVPTSIATSLGLLDIVVLDDSQQFILQNQEEHSGENRTEYILPQIGSRNIRNDGLGSTTDELVMVLTDQDYKDGHSTITADNSNIVVLYSHPADGQQGQFITSQGNLMVNSDTGLLEIRNGATIATTSSSQIVVTDSESNIETIEMIQREIHGNEVLKQEPIYEEDHKPQVLNVIEQKDILNPQINVEVRHQNEQNSEDHVEAIETPVEHDAVEEVCSSLPTNANEKEIETSCKDNEQDNSVEGVEITNIVIEETEKPELTKIVPEVPTTEDTNKMENAQSDTLRTSIEFQTQTDIPFTEYESDSLVNLENESNLESHELPPKRDTIEMVVITQEKEQGEEEIAMKVHEVEEQSIESCQEQCSATEDSLKSISNEKDAEKPYSPTDNPIDMECEIESIIDPNDKQDTESVNDNENSIEVSHCEMESDNQDSIEISQCEVETDNQDSMEISQCEVETDVQDNDDNSQSSLEPPHSAQIDNVQENPSESPEESTKISILDDWEDTDSQQSDNKTKAEKKEAEETVHKLMDDWEEDETVEK